MISYSQRKRIADNFYWWCNENNAVKSVENIIHYLYLNGYLNEDKIQDDIVLKENTNKKESGN